MTTLSETPGVSLASPSSGDALATLIDQMDPITLPEMDGVALMNRVDTKFVLSKDKLRQLLENVQSEYRILEVNSLRLAPYVTLYFDTPEWECYRLHHNRKLNRRKYRMREYQTSGKTFLEIKFKSNKGRTNKKRMGIAGIVQEMTQDSSQFIQEVTGGLPDLRPQLWTLFSRITLVNRHRPERATLDWELAFRDSQRGVSLPDLVIAEIKQEKIDRSSPVIQQLRALSVRPMRLSKYCLGSMLVRPELKQNRFKKKLLKIHKITQPTPMQVEAAVSCPT